MPNIYSIFDGRWNFGISVFQFQRMEYIAFKQQRNQQKFLVITKLFYNLKNWTIFQVRFFKIDNCGAKMLWAYILY